MLGITEEVVVWKRCTRTPKLAVEYFIKWCCDIIVISSVKWFCEFQTLYWISAFSAI